MFGMWAAGFDLTHDLTRHVAAKASCLNVVDPMNLTDDVTDQLGVNGHGTAVLSVLASVAPLATFILIKVWSVCLHVNNPDYFLA